MVELQRTSSNLLEPLNCSISKVRRGISHEIEAVRLFQTFSNHIFTVGTRGGGYIYSTSGWLNHSEHPRTFSNNFSAEKAMYIQVFYMSLGWFDSTEPSRTTSSLGDQGTYTLVLGGSISTNFLELSRTTSMQRKQCV